MLPPWRSSIRRRTRSPILSRAGKSLPPLLTTTEGHCTIRNGPIGRQIEISPRCPHGRGGMMRHRMSGQREALIGLGRAALVSGVPYPTLYLWAQSGRLPCQRIDGRYFTTRQEAEAAQGLYRRPKGDTAA